MENLTIDGSAKTPLIRFAGGGSLEISGKSIPENSIDFFKPAFDWIDRYSGSPGRETLLKVNLEYFNTSSSKCLLDIFRKLERLHSAGSSAVRIQWVYEADDEDMMEAGEDYRALVKIPFELSELK